MASHSRIMVAAVLLSGLLCQQRAAAQFSLSGEDPASIRWHSIESSNFRVIYPRGSDSLATIYLRELEKYRIPNSMSIGMIQNEGLRRPLPVVLHTLNSASNGSVTWAPRRMELFTIPEWDNPSGMPWHTMLSIHEGRHAAQMQNGYRGIFKPFRYILGEIIPGAAAAYPGTLLLEGDAVVAETALTNSGRGRSAWFLNYFHHAWDRGDTRDWARWRIGSIYRHTPDNYALGYTVISAVRLGLDRPYYMSDVFTYISRRPYDPWPMEHVVRRITHKKWKENFADIRQFHQQLWTDADAARGPFQTPERISSVPARVGRWKTRAGIPLRVNTDYRNGVGTPEGDVIWVKKDIYHTPSLVRMDSEGNEKRLTGFAPMTGRIALDPTDSSILWNEVRRDPRWGQRNFSVVRSYSLSTGKRTTLRRKDNLVNPVCYRQDTLAAVKYLPDGRSRIVFISKQYGFEYGEVAMPDSLQAVQLACDGRGELFFTGITSEGFGIWRLDGDGSVSAVVAAVPGPSISNLRCSAGGLLFESDHSGVNELYRMDLSNGGIYRLTNGKYGGENFCLRSDGSVVFSCYENNGTAVFGVRKEDILKKDVSWRDPFKFSVAERLSAQERALAAQFPQPQDTLRFKTKPYRKPLGGLHLHSWAPLYADIDAVSQLSFENVTSVAALGATGWFQNDLSTISGWVAYKAAPFDGKWFHSGHLNFTYSGLYPVFDVKLHVNERDAIDYTLSARRDSIHRSKAVGRPYVRAGLQVYVPLSWNSGDMLLGLIPSANLVWTNDRYEGDNMFNPSAGVRAYAMQRTPSGCVFPRWGVGVEGRWTDPYAYVHAYGYVPGICRGQGLKASVIHQWSVRENVRFASSWASLLPRGCTLMEQRPYRGTKLSCEYAVPFYLGDWHIAECFLCQRGVVKPHFDYSSLNAANGRTAGDLWSAGASFEMNFGSFFWVNVPVTFGFSYSYSGGSLFEAPAPKYRHYLGVVFNIELPV